MGQGTPRQRARRESLSQWEKAGIRGYNTRSLRSCLSSRKALQRLSAILKLAPAKMPDKAQVPFRHDIRFAAGVALREVGGDGVALGIVTLHILGEGRAEIVVALGVVGVAGGLELGETGVAGGEDRFEARQQAEPAAGDGPAGAGVVVGFAGDGG